jgi:hypothetical protein
VARNEKEFSCTAERSLQVFSECNKIVILGRLSKRYFHAPVPQRNAQPLGSREAPLHAAGTEKEEVQWS